MRRSKCLQADALAAHLSRVGSATDPQLAQVVPDPIERGLALGELRRRGLQSDPPEGQRAEGRSRLYFLPQGPRRPHRPPRRRCSSGVASPGLAAWWAGREKRATEAPA